MEDQLAQLQLVQSQLLDGLQLMKGALITCPGHRSTTDDLHQLLQVGLKHRIYSIH